MNLFPTPASPPAAGTSEDRCTSWEAEHGCVSLPGEGGHESMRTVTPAFQLCKQRHVHGHHPVLPPGRLPTPRYFSCLPGCTPGNRKRTQSTFSWRMIRHMCTQLQVVATPGRLGRIVFMLCGHIPGESLSLPRKDRHRTASVLYWCGGAICRLFCRGR